MKHPLTYWQSLKNTEMKNNKEIETQKKWLKKE